VLEPLIHAPDMLKRVAAQFEQELHVPDCTGGTARVALPRAEGM
jgi:hypothetical protein